jgi:hypothetical protein
MKRIEKLFAEGVGPPLVLLMLEFLLCRECLPGDADPNSDSLVVVFPLTVSIRIPLVLGVTPPDFLLLPKNMVYV